MKFEQNELSEVKKFYNKSSKPVAIIDAKGKIIHVNDEFLQKFSVKPLENIKALSNEELKWDKMIKRALDIGYTTSDFPLITKPHAKTNSVKLHLIRDNSSRIIALFNITESDIKSLGVNKLKVFKKPESLVITFVPSGIIKKANDHFDKILGYSKGELIGKSICDFSKFFGHSKDVFLKSIRKTIYEGFTELSLTIQSIDEKTFHFHIKTYFDHSQGLFIMRMVDCTQKVELENRRAHKESLYEVGQLAASIAHEIRNPITTLKGFTQLLRNSTAEESEKYLTVIDDEITRMETILNEMLILSKPAVEEKAYVSLLQLVTNMVSLFQPKARIEGVSIKQVNGDLEEVIILGHEVKLKQVLLNLMKNALEAMSAGGEMSIRFVAINTEEVNIIVSDTGKGMSVNQLKQIFLPFFTTRTDGTGLGLPFVLQTIEEHGGTVSVSSEVGKGTQFILSFPTVTMQSATITKTKAFQS